MSKLTKLSIGIGFSLLIILIAGVIFLRHLVVRSFPVTEGPVSLAGLHAAVDIYRDDYGVPHINAHDEHDLMIATGYVHAQDRLWQMDLMRRAGEGRLSEVLGEKTIDIDILFRTVDLYGTAKIITDALHPQAKVMLEDYAEGVNAFIATHRGLFPIEFDMLNYKPEPWRVEHSILISRLMAWELNLAWWTDLTYGEIASKVSQEKMQEILPLYPDSISSIVPPSISKKTLAGLRDVLDRERAYRKFFGLGSLEAGSNGWVVDGSKSLSGKPLLANDPHLAMPMPSRWYELHMAAPGMNVAGVSIPGIPVIVIGHNDHLAWGLTNAMLDDADFFLEHVDSTDSSKYEFGKSSRTFDHHEELIRIHPSDSLTIIVRSTLHGPVVNDIHPMHAHRRQDEPQHRTPIAMRWTGQDVSDDLYGFYLMNHARNAHEFENGLKEIMVPGQSVVYADTGGTIAYWTTGRVPIRGKGNPLLPLSGWTGENEWKGFVPFDQLPKLINPPDHYIACANQKITEKSYPHYLSTLWEPPSRIQRIRQLLRSAEQSTPEDFKRFQQDVQSMHAQEVVNHLSKAYDSIRVDEQEISEAFNYLHNWDYRYTQSDIATTIFNAFFIRLLHNVYEDEMGEDIFNDFVFFGAIPYRVTSELLARDSSAWFDDVRTDSIETKHDILRKSLREAVHELQSSMGFEMKTWRWGNVHTVAFHHPFGVSKPLDKVFDLGPFPISGGGTTVNKTEYKFTSPYTTSVGPSMRQVIDLADPMNASIVITSGQSGQPFHQHYDDQTSLWLNGGYVQETLDWNEIRQHRWDHLELRPE